MQKPHTYETFEDACYDVFTDNYYIRNIPGLPLWGVIQSAAGAIFLITLIVTSCFCHEERHHPSSRRIFNVTCWVTSIVLVILGIFHFTTALDKQLLGVAKTLLGVTCHLLLAFIHLLLVSFYVLWGYPKWSIGTKWKWCIIFAVALTVALAIGEITNVVHFYHSRVLYNGLASINEFWIGVRVFWTIVYTSIITVSLIPQFGWKMMSPSIFDFYLYSMLALNLLGLIGRIGVQAVSPASSFGCIATSAQLSEHIILVPLIGFCSHYYFKWFTSEPTEYIPLPENEDVGFNSGNDEDRY